MIPALAILRRFWPLGVIIVAIGLTLLLVRCTDRAQDKAVTVSHEAGRERQRADDLSETINRTLEANNAAETILRDPVARNAECLRHSRTPENCK